MYSTEHVNKSNEDKIKQYHRKRLLELSLKSLGEIPQLDDPTEEQKEWMKKHGF
jgi:hypothetical protein